MSISKHISELMSGSSFIRKMFETGALLKAEYGDDKVFDFSIGNPDMPPVSEFGETLQKIIAEDIPGKHGYMPNAGYTFAREAVAGWVSGEQKTGMGMNSIVMTCGAGGGMNTVLKSVINPGDRVIVSAPCFMEYKFYCDNHGGRLEIVKPRDDFTLDPAAFEAALDKDVAAVIINSPNNPSGRIYPEENIRELAEVLRASEKRTGRAIYLICDEPYKKIVFDGAVVPAIFPLYDHAVLVTSYSKDLSIPGERIGFVAVNPAADDFEALVNAIILCNRIMGFVNAPAMMQRAITGLQGASVSMEAYRRKRDILCEGLADIGYEFEKPAGTFYLFPKTPGGDDAAFVDLLLQEKVLVVPGSGFAMPGYFRISYCVEDSVIHGSMAGFRRAFEKIK